MPAASRAIDAPSESASDPGRGTASPFGERPLRILLVEDNAPHAELGEHFLRQSGLQLELQRAETSEPFLPALESHRPDMILSDYALPTFDGYSALALAREKAPH